MTERDDAGLTVREAFERGIEAMRGSIELLTPDAPTALAQLTWLGMRMAEQAQALTDAIELGEEEEAAPRYLSMDGLLCGPNGAVVHVDWERWDFLGEHAVGLVVAVNADVEEEG